MNELEVLYSRLFGWLPSGAIDSDWFSRDGKTWDPSADWKSNSNDYLATHEFYSSFIFGSMKAALEHPLTDFKKLPAELVLFIERVVSRSIGYQELYPVFYRNGLRGPLEMWCLENKLPQKQIELACNFYNKDFQGARMVPLSVALEVSISAAHRYSYIDRPEKFENAILYDLYGFLDFATQARPRGRSEGEYEIHPRYRRFLGDAHPFSQVMPNDRAIAAWFSDQVDSLGKSSADLSIRNHLESFREDTLYRIRSHNIITDSDPFKLAEAEDSLNHFFHLSTIHGSAGESRKSGIVDIWALVSPLTGYIHEIILWTPFYVSVRKEGIWEPTSKDELYRNDFGAYCVFQVDWNTDPLVITAEFDFEDPDNEHRIVQLFDSGQLTIDEIVRDCDEIICSNSYSALDGLDEEA